MVHLLANSVPALLPFTVLLARLSMIGVQALPTHGHHARAPEGSSTSLVAILIAGPLIALLLFVAKWVFLRRRKRTTSRSFGSGKQWKWLTSHSPWHNEGSLSNLPMLAPFPSTNGKQGFLVGLFGSPSWETRYSNIPLSGEVSFTRTDPSVGSRDHSNHRRSTSILGNTKIGYGSGISACSSVRDKKVEPDLSEILSWPSPALSFTEGAFLIFDNKNDRMAPLGCYNWQLDSCTGHLNASILSDSRSKELRELDSPRPRVCTWPAVGIVPPEPALLLTRQPINSVSSFKLLQPKTMDLVNLNNSPSLEPTTHLQSSESRPLILSDPGTLFFDQASQPSENIFTSTHPALPSSSPSTKPTPHNSMLSAAYLSTKLSNSPSKSRTSVTISPPPSRIQRQSPGIRPSPLRTMFLPPARDHTCLRSEDSDSGAAPLRSDNLATAIYKSRSCHPTGDTNGVITIPNQKGGPRGRTKRPIRHKKHLRGSKELDSDNLFGLLQELVQETSAWDASLFVDNSFKAMIDDSRLSIKPRAPQKSAKRVNRKSTYTIPSLEDIPEIDAEVTPID